jgi:hypothetical protein
MLTEIEKERRIEIAKQHIRDKATAAGIRFDPSELIAAEEIDGTITVLLRSHVISRMDEEGKQVIENSPLAWWAQPRDGPGRIALLTPWLVETISPEIPHDH